MITNGRFVIVMRMRVPDPLRMSAADGTETPREERRRALKKMGQWDSYYKNVTFPKMTLLTMLLATLKDFSMRLLAGRRDSVVMIHEDYRTEYAFLRHPTTELTYYYTTTYMMQTLWNHLTVFGVGVGRKAYPTLRNLREDLKYGEALLKTAVRAIKHDAAASARPDPEREFEFEETDFEQLLNQCGVLTARRKEIIRATPPCLRNMRIHDLFQSVARLYHNVYAVKREMESDPPYLNSYGLSKSKDVRFVSPHCNNVDLLRNRQIHSYQLIFNYFFCLMDFLNFHNFFCHCASCQSSVREECFKFDTDSNGSFNSSFLPKLTCTEEGCPCLPACCDLSYPFTRPKMRCMVASSNRVDSLINMEANLDYVFCLYLAFNGFYSDPNDLGRFIGCRSSIKLACYQCNVRVSFADLHSVYSMLKEKSRTSEFFSYLNAIHSLASANSSSPTLSLLSNPPFSEACPLSLGQTVYFIPEEEASPTFYNSFNHANFLAAVFVFHPSDFDRALKYDANNFHEDIRYRCVVCMSRRANYMFVPCNHLCLCVTCAKKIVNTSKACVFCKQTFKQIVKIFQC